MKKLIALLLAVAAPVFSETYSVKVLDMTFTNVVEIIPDHEKQSPPCTLLRYVANGMTNEFHAWMVKIHVMTNAPVGFEAGKRIVAWTNKEKGVYVTSNLPPTAPEVVIRRCREAGSLTNLINALVADGSFCQARGHKWEFGAGGITTTLLYEDPSAARPARHCGVCGRVQTKDVGEWK